MFSKGPFIPGMAWGGLFCFHFSIVHLSNIKFQTLHKEGFSDVQIYLLSKPALLLIC